MAQVRKFLDLSTAHLDAEDRDYLQTCAEPGSYFGLPTYRTTHSHLDHIAARVEAEFVATEGWIR